MKRLILIVILSSFFFLESKGQAELSVFNSTGRAGVATTFATDYQSIGINPANLGWDPKFEDKKISFTVLEVTSSIYSEALSKPEMRTVLKDAIDDQELQEFSSKEKKDAAIKFTASENAINVDVMPLGFAIQTENAGGFAIAVRERLRWYSEFNKNMSEIMFMGYNAPYFNQIEVDSLGDTTGVSTAPQVYSDLLEGSKLKLTWMREFNLSYGRHIIKNENFQLFGGVGLKYIQGLGIIDIDAGADEFTAFSAVTPTLGIDYGDDASSNPSYIEDGGSGVLPESVGQGFGVDIGFSAIINEKLKIGASLNDFGSVTWDGNVFQVNNDTLKSISSDGFDSYNFIKEAEEITNDNGIFAWQGLQTKKVELPMNLRAGASYELFEKLEVGVDAVMPMNDAAGNYQDFLFAFGADFRPISWLTLSSGFASGGNYGFNIPIGLTFTSDGGTWEAGIASRDVITFFTDNSPTLSASFGFFRFRI